MIALSEDAIERGGLNRRLVQAWRMAARELGVRVVAPISLIDGAGGTFVCEALVQDFGSPRGALIISRRTERRVRESVGSLGEDLWVSVEPDRQPSNFHRAYFVDALRDLGWFGSPGEEPSWYSG